MFPKWWSDPHKRKLALELKLGLIHRPQDVPHVPKGSDLDHELHLFQVWALWWASGRVNKRPVELKGWKPAKDYWPVLTEYIAKHHQPPAPPPKPPASNPQSKWTGHPNVPWYHKRVDIDAWFKDKDMATLLNGLHASGTKAVTFQFGDDCPNPNWLQDGLRLYDAAKADGFICGIWGRCDYRPWEEVKRDLHAAMSHGCDGLMADVEGECEDQQLPEHLAAEFPEIPMAVIATGGIDEAFPNHTPGEVAARFGGNFDFVSQCYHKAENPLTPAMSENFVWWRSTDKNNGKGFRHMPDHSGRYHSTTIMSYAENCPPLMDHHAWCDGWGPLAHWDAEILQGNGAWNAWATF